MVKPHHLLREIHEPYEPRNQLKPNYENMDVNKNSYKIKQLYIFLSTQVDSETFIDVFVEKLDIFKNLFLY